MAGDSLRAPRPTVKHDCKSQREPCDRATRDERADALMEATEKMTAKIDATIEAALRSVDLLVIGSAGAGRVARAGGGNVKERALLEDGLIGEEDFGDAEVAHSRADLTAMASRTCSLAASEVDDLNIGWGP